LLGVSTPNPLTSGQVDPKLRHTVPYLLRHVTTVTFLVFYYYVILAL